MEPDMTDHDATMRLLTEALQAMDEGFGHLPEYRLHLELGPLREALLAAADRMRGNYPYHHPLYIGQMLKPPHPVARLAYALAMALNPNNHALDGGRASSAMEKEAVAAIAQMLGWQTHLGHLCGGGTMANFEALWVGRELHPGRAVAASAQAHYTHSRLSALLGVPFRAIPVDDRGRMNVPALEQSLASGEIGTVVVTLGTTAAGAVDPLPELLSLREQYRFRVHVDAAYGGYFTLTDNLGPETRRVYDSLARADSLVIDPHKHGLQPYGCGCVLFRDPTVGRFYKHDSPYTYFSSSELHLGEISLECSRPGASAVALWTTMRLFPLLPGGAFAQGLTACRDAALALHAALMADPRFVPLVAPELDIVVWAVRARSAQESSVAARRVFEAAAERDLHVALARLPRVMAEPAAPVSQWDAEDLLCLRACAMKPDHRNWIEEIVARLHAAADIALGQTSPN